MKNKGNGANLHLFTLAIIFLFGLQTAFAQDSSFKTLKPVFVQGSLLYDFPQSFGFTGALDYPLKAIVKNRISRKGTVSVREKDRFCGLEIGGYRYPYNYTGILVVPFIGWRHYARPSFFNEIALGVGVLRTFYDGKIYEVDANGNVNEKSLFGRFYATTHLSYAFNFVVQKQAHPILTLQLKPALWFQYPFNSFIKPHVSLEAGIKYEIKKRSTKTSKITKYRRK